EIRLFTEDTQSKPEEAANAVAKLISEHDVVAILGEVASSRTLAAAPIAQSREIPMISPASTNPKVTEVGDYIFRVAYVDTFQAQALAGFIREELELRKGAILKDVKNDYSMGLAQYFTEAFEALGGEIVIDQNYNEGDIDFSSQLAAVNKTDPDFLFIPGYYAEAAQIARQSRQHGMNLPLIGADGWESPELLTVGGEALEGAHFSSPFFADDPRPAIHDFVERFTELHDVAPDAIAALGYDAARLLADAMERAESLKPQAIRDAIASTTGFSGVTGEITIGPKGDTIKPIVILRIQNGETTLAARVSADGEVIAPPRPESDAADGAGGKQKPSE
ncbi:MAG: ABC transporter substrate-binding protein, partial [Acidobacteria bacterium]|nr:ABC transporter substrate-binding protein [Acidobacteriota bacterium]